MKIYGIQKTTLLDFPKHLACTVFLYGCNFRCSFCQNKELILPQAETHFPDCFPIDDFFSFLSKRKHILEGVCITGGEPSLWKEELISFIERIHSYDLKVKLDTNGSDPALLEQLLRQNALDYVAMDIKSSRSRYPIICDCPVEIEKICESVKLLLKSSCPYEFRTTLVKELHSVEDILDIRDWITGSKAYYLQSYRPSEQCIRNDYHSFSKSELLDFQRILREKIPHTFLRGIDE